MNLWQKFLKWYNGSKDPMNDQTVYNYPITDKCRKAICMGINDYKGKASNLSGCVNDALNMTKLLKDTYRYNKIITLLDEEVTVKNFKLKLAELLTDPKPDVITISYSGHGSSVADLTEKDGRAETWYLSDGNVMDKDIRAILATIPNTCKVTVFSDSCHSQGVTREFLEVMNDFTYVSIPKIVPANSSGYASRAIFEVENCEDILLAGCQSHQYSYDVVLDGKPCGAFTGYTLKILKQNSDITYGSFIEQMSKYLPSTKYPQVPVLECNETNKDTKIFS